MARVELPDHLLAGFIPGMANRRPEKKRETSKAVSKRFQTILDDVEARENQAATEVEPFSEAEAATLLDAVHLSGEAIRKDAHPDNIKAYKKAVRDFVHYVVQRAYDVDEQTSGRNILKRKKYTTVVIVDGKLERLAAELMSAQRDRLDILERLDEIYGLLVDLLR
jgi:hypothetical protein